MALVHDPFRPTPDSEDWNDLSKRNEIIKSLFSNLSANVIFASGYGQPNKFLNDPLKPLRS